MTDDLAYTSAAELAALIARRAVSPVEVVDAVLGHIERAQPALNAFITVCGQEARAAAKGAEAAVMRGDTLGPLHGVPFAVKDLVNTKGVRTTFGSVALAENVPSADSPAVARLKVAGAILVGKTTTPEFGHKCFTEAPLFGRTANPWDLSRTCGGSSGGAAAAVADIEGALGFPLVVKPASQGSALGVKFARTSDQLPGAMVGAFSYDDKILIERYVKGRDLAVSVLSGPADPSAPAADPGLQSSARRRTGDTQPGGAQPFALPVVEAVPREEDFYDYESRYEIGMTTFVCPADLGADTTARAQELALEVYELFGCHGVARVDLMLDADGDSLWVLETNAVPGLTETSLLPQAADAAGIGFDELTARVLASAWTR